MLSTELILKRMGLQETPLMQCFLPPLPHQVVPAKPQYSNPELQLVADEIEELNADKLKLESEIHQKEAGIRVKNNEIKNLQVSVSLTDCGLLLLKSVGMNIHTCKILSRVVMYTFQKSFSPFLVACVIQ